MRTYTVREVRGSGADTRLVVDFVLHLAEGATGPASSWAATAAVGDRLVTWAPRRGVPFGGIEFPPGDGTNACCWRATRRRYLRSAASSRTCRPNAPWRGVPRGARIRRPAAAPAPGRGWTWSGCRGTGLPLGQRLYEAVLAHLGSAAADGSERPGEVDPDLWETPTYSSSGEDTDVPDTVRGPRPRRALRVDRGGVRGGHCAASAPGEGAGRGPPPGRLMGYWRRGVAMRS